MNNDIFTHIKEAIAEQELPGGHKERFRKKLRSMPVVSTRMVLLQRVAIAASIAAFLVLSVYLTLNLDNMKTHGNFLYHASSDLYETEQYLSGEIEEKLDEIAHLPRLDWNIKHDLREIDMSFREIKKDMKENPNDLRLINAVIETYRIKISVLDEILIKNHEDKI